MSTTARLPSGNDVVMVTTLATSLIWGVNTLFLLDAGLNNTEAFAANAFFSIGMVIFEVPTGVVADVYSRRLSILAIGSDRPLTARMSGRGRAVMMVDMRNDTGPQTAAQQAEQP